MKNKKTILAAVVASVVASASSHAKLSGTYVGLSGIGVLNDSSTGMKTSAVGNMSTITLGWGLEIGYNTKFDNFLLGAGLSYIYATPNFKHIAEANKMEVAALSQGINGHRINLDINAGYSFEDKVVLSVGGIISYNPGKPEYTIPKTEYFDEEKRAPITLPAFDKKTTSDFGFGFKVGANFKLTECVSWDVSYRMTWFSTTKDYKDYVKSNKILLGGDDAIKVSELSRVDKMITTGIRFNF